MTTLQTRLAQADKPTRELLEEVYAAIFPTPDSGRSPRDGIGWAAVAAKNPAYLEWCNNKQRFTAMLDAEAWTSAVEMLVPADVEWNCESWTNSGIYSEPVRATAWVFGAPRSYAATPALALAIACLNARGL